MRSVWVWASRCAGSRSNRRRAPPAHAGQSAPKGVIQLRRYSVLSGRKLKEGGLFSHRPLKLSSLAVNSKWRMLNDASIVFHFMPGHRSPSPAVDPITELVPNATRNPRCTPVAPSLAGDPRKPRRVRGCSPSQLSDADHVGAKRWVNELARGPDARKVGARWRVADQVSDGSLLPWRVAPGRSRSGRIQS